MTTVLLHGDCIEVMHTIPDKYIQCCVTSPPYFGLRDYGVSGQLGLEQTPDAYIANMVAVFREVWRVMRDDATLWLNIGDSYASAWASGRRNIIGNGSRDNRIDRCTGTGLKEKDMIGIPWRLAFALQAPWRQCLTCGTVAHDMDWGKVRKNGQTYFVCPTCMVVRVHRISERGWYLRSDIIWAKPNPMPESVTDRPTKAHEYVFLLTKNARYYYDADAVKEGVSENTHSRGPKYHKMNKTAETGSGIKQNESFTAATWGRVSSRNRRTVWTINTKPYKGAHFATFPEKLVEPCILAGTSERGCCPKCGKPWERVTERPDAREKDWDTVKPNERGVKGGDYGWQPDPHRAERARPIAASDTVTTGWRPGCECFGRLIKTVWLDDSTGIVTQRERIDYEPEGEQPDPA